MCYESYHMTTMTKLLVISLVITAWTIAPRSSFADEVLAKKLNDEAQKEVVRQRIPQAVVLLQAAWEMSRNVIYLRYLGQAHTMAGHFDEAIDAYKLLLKHNPPPDLAQRAKGEIKRLQGVPAPFTEKLLARVRLTEHAIEAFKMGRALIKKKKTEQAIRLLRAALTLDPELPGTYRLLGAIYGKMKDPKKEQQFLLDYLRISPGGRLADMVRKRLKPSGILGEIDVDASFSCDIWINGRSMKKKSPMKGLLLPSGSHTISFVNAEYHIIRNKRVRIRSGKNPTLTFEFGVITFKLDPWARVRANGKDLGLWNTIGLPTGEYLFSLEAHDGSRKKETRIFIQPSKKITVDKW